MEQTRCHSIRVVVQTGFLIGACTAVAAAMQPSSRVSEPDFPDQFADIDDSVRFVPSTRPAQPTAQRPPLSTEKNVDTGRPVPNWQRLTDDWMGLRPKLDDRGISIAMSSTGDFSKVLSGGVNTEDADFAYLINLNVTVNTTRLFGLRGGTFFINFQQNGGTDVAENAGNFLGITNIAADNRTQISEIWYEQLIFEDAVRLKAGKIDVNSEFAASEYAGEFINPSAELPPNLLSLPSYPDPAFGGMVGWQPCNGFSVAGGAFDGAAQEGYTTGDNGPATLFGDPADLFLIGEAATMWEFHGCAGRLALGGFHHTGTFDRFDGGTEGGSSGGYIVVDQRVYKEEPDNDEDMQGLGVFARVTLADESVSEAKWHAACGGAWQGLVHSRDDDIVGLAIYWTRFSDDSAAGFDTNDEVSFEAFYKLQLTRFASMKPDLQYIINPGGVDDLDNALVASVRFSLEF